MGRIARLEKRIDELEKDMAAVRRLKIVSAAPINQLLSAQTDTALPVKSGPTDGEVNLEAGTINLR